MGKYVAVPMAGYIPPRLNDYNPERVYPIVAFPLDRLTFRGMQLVLDWTKGFFSPALDEINRPDYETAPVEGKHGLFIVAAFVVKPRYFKQFEAAVRKHHGFFVKNLDNNPKPDWMR